MRHKLTTMIFSQGSRVDKELALVLLWGTGAVIPHSYNVLSAISNQRAGRHCQWPGSACVSLSTTGVSKPLRSVGCMRRVVPVSSLLSLSTFSLRRP